MKEVDVEKQEEIALKETLYLPFKPRLNGENLSGGTLRARQETTESGARWGIPKFGIVSYARACSMLL
jgi:hypothetical protein